MCYSVQCVTFVIKMSEGVNEQRVNGFCRVLIEVNGEENLLLKFLFLIYLPSLR